MAVLQKREEWKGQYKNIDFSIVHWQLGWNYYLHIHKDQLPEDIRIKFNLRAYKFKLSDDGNEHIGFHYESAPYISNLEWHGGITYYEKVRDGLGQIIGYKLGCDYMHHFDIYHNYDLDTLIRDVEQSIDKLHELIPNMKVRCNWDGKFYDIVDTYITDKGQCVALKNKANYDKPLFEAKE